MRKARCFNKNLKFFFLSFVIILFMPFSLWAGINQWTGNGPQGGVIRSIGISPNYATDKTVFVGSYNYGVCKSTDWGQNWTKLNAVPTWVNSIAISPNYATDETVFVGVDWDSVYRSTDGGQNWTQLGVINAYSIAISPNYATDKTVFVGNPHGIYKSIDGGQNWTQVSNMDGGFSIAISPTYATDATLFAINANLYVFKSTDGGQNWTEIDGSFSSGLLPAGFVRFIAFSPNYATDKTVFAGSFGIYNLYKSTDGGQNWTQIGVNNGLPDGGITSVIISPNYATDNTVFADTDYYGIYKSTDGGQNWTQLNSGLLNGTVYSVAISPNYVNDETVFAGTAGAGVYKSTDGGQNWTQLNSGLLSADVPSVAISPNYVNDETVFAGTNSSVYKSTDRGQNWTQINNGLPYSEGNYSVAISSNYTTDGTVFVGLSGWPTPVGAGIYKSTNGGQNWTQINNGLPSTAVHYTGVSSIAISPNYATDATVFAGTNYGIYKSTDGGQNWTQSGLIGANSFAISPNYATDATIFAGSSDCIYKSTDGGQNWTQLNSPNPGGDYSVAAISPNYATDATVFAGNINYMYKSTNGGQNWTQIFYGQSSFAISPNYATDKTVFLGMNGLVGGSVIYKSTDGGQNWTQINNWFPGWTRSIAISPNYVTDTTVFAGINGEGVLSYTFSNPSGDTTPPFTTASPAGGNYVSAQSVVLTCTDGGDSGCRTIYYCTGTDCTPTTVYSGVIHIGSSSVLRFFSKDYANNSESIKTETYTILTHNITASAGTNGSITPSGSVSVSDNATQSFTVSHNNGYVPPVMSGTCGGNMVGNTYTTNPITTDCTVTATFNPTGSSQTLPPDNNVQVPVNVSLPSGGSTTANITFTQVNTVGTLSVTATNTAPSGQPSGFKFLDTYYDVTYTGSFSGYIYITFPYKASSVPSGSEQDLRLYHWPSSGGREDCTYALDTNNNTITGRVTSLSPFGIGYLYSTTTNSGGSSSGHSTGANENMIALIAILSIAGGVFLLRRRRFRKS